MSTSTVLPIKLKVTFHDIVQLHVKYLNEGTVQTYIECPKIVINQDVIRIFYYCNLEKNHKLEEKLIRQSIDEIITNVENVFKKISKNAVELLVYDFIENIYNNIDQNDWKCYFTQLRELYFEKINGTSQHISKEYFQKLIKLFLPHTKLKNVIENVHHKITSPASLLVQIFECIKCPLFLREDCYEVVFDCIGTNDYELLSFVLKPLMHDIGFLGQHFKLNITIKQNQVRKVLHFFAKFIPRNNKLCEILALSSYKKEEFVYKTFVSLLKKSGYEQLLKFAPKCHFSRVNDVIVLEDLSPLGFHPQDIYQPVSLDWMVMVAKQMSRLHACSLILDRKFSLESGLETYTGDVFSDYLHEINFDKNNSNCWFMYFGGKLISEYFAEKLSDICKNLPLKEFKKKAMVKVEEAFENVKRSKKYYNVICHGDLWGSNILSNTSMDCFFIDYQIIRYCPAPVDLLFAIYINSDRNLRLNHINEIFHQYYNNLKENLSMFNIDVNDFFTEEEFLKSVEYFKATGIVQSLVYLQMLLCPKDFIEVLKTDATKAERFYTLDRRDIYDAAWDFEPFRTRIRGLMEELYEICEQQ